MKREILFRGKRVDNGKWVFGFIVINNDGKHYIKDTDYNVNNGKIDLIPEEVVPETVGQFTGRIDLDGNKIFEDDIVLHGQSNRFIEYRRTNFCATRLDKTESILLSFSESPKVIGNIYDNPPTP